ncbi:hypothetical protein EYF80_013732 [Liparis tanakae]|uniref:Uncharacterized protein n=1 Tax=Liparis tanakae TaxID=230148 RepID=A0A4Z2ID13_9TELE|nr:hypothetical protein EYF80_013732 [Liparis tanakae]
MRVDAACRALRLRTMRNYSEGTSSGLTHTTKELAFDRRSAGAACDLKTPPGRSPAVPRAAVVATVTHSGKKNVSCGDGFPVNGLIYTVGDDLCRLQPQGSNRRYTFTTVPHCPMSPWRVH